MKYYSEVTKKFYDTIIDCQREEAKAQKEAEEKAAKERVENERRDKMKTELNEAYNVYKNAKKAYFEKLKEAEKLNVSWTNPDAGDLSSVLDLMFGRI